MPHSARTRTCIKLHYAACRADTTIRMYNKYGWKSSEDLSNRVGFAGGVEPPHFGSRPPYFSSKKRSERVGFRPPTLTYLKLNAFMHMRSNLKEVKRCEIGWRGALKVKKCVFLLKIEVSIHVGVGFGPPSSWRSGYKNYAYRMISLFKKWKTWHGCWELGGSERKC